MAETLRLFIAVEVPEAVRDALGTVQSHLHGRQSSNRNLRLVRLESIHLTLTFLGNVEAKRVGDVASVMRGVAPLHAPIALSLADLGAFPNEKAPRVVWAEVNGDVQALTALRGAIEQALVESGFPAEPRAFRPHLTLARARNGERPYQVDGLHAALTNAGLPDGLDFAVSNVALIQSTLGPGGASYETLASETLGG